MPLDGVLSLLLEAQVAHGEVAAIEQALLARLRGGEGNGLEPTSLAIPRRLRGDVTVREFARAAGVRPATIYGWISAGRLTVKKRGVKKQSRVRISLSELRPARSGPPAPQRGWTGG